MVKKNNALKKTAEKDETREEGGGDQMKGGEREEEIQDKTKEGIPCCTRARVEKINSRRRRQEG